jgi:central kinetochore subunit Mal2/MCM21
MSASLLSSRKLKPLLQTSKPARQRIDNVSRQKAISAVDKAVAAVSASTARTTSGITAFHAKDPDPNAIGDGNLLGVRLDLYSTRNRGFQAPYFLLFQKLDNGRMKLHQHTIPTFIPLRSLWRRYMSNTEGDEDSSAIEGKAQNLLGFVRAIRKNLVAWVRRTDAIEQLRENAASVGTGELQISNVTSTDPSAMELELQLQNDAVLRIRMTSSGTIEKSSVRTKDANDLSLRRMLERALASHKGRIDELAAVLQ